MSNNQFFKTLIRQSARPAIIAATFWAGYALGNRRNDSQHHRPLLLSHKRRAFLIDWDGCLCDSAPRIIKRINLVATELKRRYPTLQLDESLLLLPCTGELASHLQKVFGESYAKEAHSLYMEYMNHPEIPPKRPFDGAEEFLQKLKDEGTPFAIVSNGTDNFVRQGIKDFAWEQLFSDVPIVTVDSVKTLNKPNPRHFQAALDILKINLDNPDDPFEIIIIGDGKDSDMLGALNFADSIAKPHITVSAFWTNHNKNTPCQLMRSHAMPDNPKYELEKYLKTILSQ